jgi:hypothetical protein
MSTTQSLTIALCLGSLLSASALAQGFRLEPGNWEMTSKRRMSMMPGEKTETDRQCITKAQTDPTQAMETGGHCQVVDRTETENSVEWKMECDMDGTAATGTGMVQSNGDTATGRLSIEMTVQGTPASFEMEWSGRRLGDC